MRFFILIVISWICLSTVSETVYAQNKLSGTITDAQNTPVVTASIALFTSADSTLHKLAISEDNGKFIFDDLSPAHYYLRITHINYYDTLVDINAIGNDMQIHLRHRDKGLKETVVTSFKPLIEHKTDRTIFNVENSIAAAGTDALEVLRKAPGVIVQDNNISIAGKSTVRIMINDRLLQLSGEDLINFLKTISADDITRIEIITNPGAQYDAEGNTGLLNIVLKKSKRDGLNGNIRATYEQHVYSIANTGANINYTNDKISTYFSFFSQTGYNGATEDMTIAYPQQYWTKHNTRAVATGNISSTAGVDYKLNANTTLGLMYTGGYNAPNFMGHISNSIYNSTGSLDSMINTETHTIQNTSRHSFNLDLQTKLDTTGKKLNLDADYFIYNSNKDRDVASNTFIQENVLPSSLNQTKSYAKQQIDIYTLKGDLTLPYKFATITAGVKLSFINNNTPADYYNVIGGVLHPDTGNTDHYIYSENTQALYISGQKELGKWSVQAGLRGEFTETKSESHTLSQTNTNSYFKLFPTLFITYEANKNNNFALTYGRRIDRPGYWATNPFKFYSTPYYYQQGNPFLQPSFTNNLELSHTYKNMLTTSFNFYNTMNEIEGLTIVQPNSNIIASLWSNYINSYSYGFTEAFNYSRIPWLETNTELILFYYKAYSNYAGTEPSKESLSCNFTTDNTIIFNKARTVMAVINYWYQFPNLDGVIKNEALSYLELGIKLSTPNKKWTVALIFTDIFRTEIHNSSSVVNGIIQTTDGYYDNRGVRLNLNYKFGGDKQTRTHTTGNEEETNRAR